MSQEDLAHRVGVDRASVQRWEVGRSSPQPLARRVLADVLGVDLSALDGLLATAAATTTDEIDALELAGRATRTDAGSPRSICSNTRSTTSRRATPRPPPPRCSSGRGSTCASSPGCSTDARPCASIAGCWSPAGGSRCWPRRRMSTWSSKDRPSPGCAPPTRWPARPLTTRSGPGAWRRKRGGC
ncbi:MAG: helix-turn-helix domain-containing protein [Pseudonocardia sp.]|nr:helix-turn-helix domain-containing protein [Pseudonocardia sp.]